MLCLVTKLWGEPILRNRCSRSTEIRNDRLSVKTVVFSKFIYEFDALL
jgi:hypothetical protein